MKTTSVSLTCDLARAMASCNPAQISRALNAKLAHQTPCRFTILDDDSKLYVECAPGEVDSRVRAWLEARFDDSKMLTVEIRIGEREPEIENYQVIEGTCYLCRDGHSEICGCEQCEMRRFEDTQDTL